MRFITFKRLKEEWHFPFSRVHTRRLVKDGKFPEPYPMGDRRIAWDEDEIIDWYKNRRRNIRKPPPRHAPDPPNGPNQPDTTPP